MVTNPVRYLYPIAPAPRRRIALWTVLVLGLALLATLVVLNASANPPNAAEVRIQGWVGELQSDRLTARRHNAQRELEKAGKDAVPALTVALRSDNAVLRRNAADMLGFIASPLAIPNLQYTLANDSTPAVRRNAAWALGEMDSFVPFHDLQRAALLDTNALVRETAQDSLARMRTRLALSAGIDERELNSYAVAPTSRDVIYAATRRNLVITRDGGKTWTTLENALPSMASVLVVSPTNALTLYAGIDSLGMYKSVDGGREWHAINDGLDIPAGARYVISAITVDATEPQRVLIATGVLVGTSKVELVPTGIRRSDDGGMTWKVMQTQVREPVTQLAVKGNQVYALAGKQVMVYRLS